MSYDFQSRKQALKLEKNVRGAVAVEMALLLIPLIVMAFGVAEFGRAIYQYNTLTKSVRDAARFMSQRDINNSSYVDDAKCLAVYGTVNCSGAALVPGLEEKMVTISSSTKTTAVGTTINLVEVSITGYEFQFVFNPLVFFGNSDASITFGPIQTTMRQL